MNKISFWLFNARKIALPQSLLPAFTALAIAGAAENEFSWIAAILCVIGISCAHLGMNLADDWFDYRVHSGEMRQKLASEGIRARMIKYPYLTSGEATTKELLVVIIIFLTIAAGCGITIAIMRGWNILWFALAGFIIGISYSGAPLRLGFRGLGELVIFLVFGPLLMTGTYYAVTGHLSETIMWISAAVGLLVTNIVYCHSIMDAEHDIKVGKKTMAHLMGSSKGQLALCAVINILPYLLITIEIILKQLHPAYIATIATLPMSIWLIKSINDFIYKRNTEIKARPWIGSEKSFENYKAAGIDWFMLRWLTARNIVTFFCLIIIIVSIILVLIH